MTQNGGLDVLAACCMFGLLLALLGWVLLRHHDNPVDRALTSDDDGPPIDGETAHDDEGSRDDRAGDEGTTGKE